MRHLLKLIAVLVAFFLLAALLSTELGGLTAERVDTLIAAADSISPWMIAAAIIFLLSVDLLLAIPTLSVTLSAGYFLGIALGSLVAFTGMTFCALIGYELGRRSGDKLLGKILRRPEARREMRAAFAQDGPVMILLSRGAPVLPEITACLAGTTRMPIALWLALHTASTVPYVVLATYIGSRMRDDDPTLPIVLAIMVYAMLWGGWLAMRRRRKHLLAQTPGGLAS